MATIKVFSIKISGRTLDSYVDIESLQEIEQQVEGDGIWQYKVNSVSITLDKSALKEFNLTENNVENLYKLSAEIYYYETLILAGIVGEVSYDFEDESIELEIHSFGKVIADFDIELFDNSFGPDGLSLVGVRHQLSRKINTLLSADNYPFTLNSGIKNYAYDYTAINVDDFVAFKKPTAKQIFLIPQILGVYKKNLSYYRTLLDAGTERWVGLKNIIFNYNYYVPISETGELDIENAVYPRRVGDITLTPVDVRFEKAEDFETSDGLVKYIKTLYFEDTDSTTLYGQAKVGDYYWVVINRLLFRVELSESDLFIFKYENAKAGQIQADFAVATNSITWVGTDRYIYYQSREGRTGLNNPKNIIDVDVEMIDQRGNDLEFPNQIFIAEGTKTSIENYYTSYLSGIFKKYTILIDRNEFSSNEYPLLLKNLHVKIRGVDTNVGIIKKVIYQENLLQIETEWRKP